MKWWLSGLVWMGLGVGCQEPPTPSAPPVAATVTGLSPAAPPLLGVLDLWPGHGSAETLGAGLLWQGDRLVQVAVQDAEVVLLFWQGGAVVQRLALDVPAETGRLLADPDGTLLWLPDTHRSVLQLDPQTGAVQPRARLPAAALAAGAVTADGATWILSGGNLLCLRPGQAPVDIPGIPVPTALAAQGDALWVAEAREDGRGGLWRRDAGGTFSLLGVTDEPTPERLLAPHSGGVVVAGVRLSRWTDDGALRWQVPSPGPAVALADVGAHLALLTPERLLLYDDSTGALVASVAVIDAGDMVAEGGGDTLLIAEGGGLSRIAAHTGRLRERWSAAPTPTRVLPVAGSGERVVLDVQGGRLSIWPEGSTTLEDLPDAGRPVAAALVRDVVVSLDLSGELRLWSAAQRTALGQVALGSDGAGWLAVDLDSGIAVVGHAHEVIAVHLRDREVLWRLPLAGDAVAAGGGRVYALDTIARRVTALAAETGAVLGTVDLTPPRHQQRPRRGTPLLAALLYDASTDRLFCGRVVLDGRTLAVLAVLPGVDRVLAADQHVLVARKDGVSGTRSVLVLDATSLTPLQRTPLTPQAEGERALTYDAEQHRLYLAEASRSRVLTWPYPQQSP